MKRLLFVSLVALVTAACAPVSSGDRVLAVAPIYEEQGFTTANIAGMSWAVPQGMDLGQYPILGRKLTEAEVIQMRLRLSVVPAGTVLWNEDSKHKAFWLDTMKKERKVWVDQADQVVYIEDCGNRAMSPLRVPRCPDSVVCQAPHFAAIGGNDITTGVGGQGWDFGWLGDLLLFLLGLALLALAVFALAWLIRELVNGYRLGGGFIPPRPGPAPVPVVPGVVRPRHFGPRSAVVGPVPPPPPPQATFQRFGPFDHIAIDDAGDQGYRVTGHNGDQEVPLGTYRWAETENAGDQGEFVIVMV